MILIDPRVGSKELHVYIQRLNIPCQVAMLEYGDAAFEGNGPESTRIMVGVERKKVSDMLNCIDDARYAAHQRPGMLQMYNRDILIIEGVWKPDFNTGYLQELVRSLTWQPYRYRGSWVRYHKLFRYLLSIQMAGTIVIPSRDVEQTAFNITELWSYFQKKWEDHTSLLETQKLCIPEMRGKPSLVRRWAADLDGVGVKHSLAAEKMFKSPIDLAKSDESGWARIPGITFKLARKIVQQIHGASDDD